MTAATVGEVVFSPGSAKLRAVLNSQISRVPVHLRRALGYVGRLGFGRQGALAAARRAFPARVHTPLYRVVALLVGSLLIGTAVGLLRQADLGLSPFDVLVSGLQPRVGLSFGQTVWLISGVLFAVAAILGQRPSGWGIAHVVANGLAIDAVAGIVNQPSALAARVGFVAAAIVVLSAGISVVVHSGAAGGSFELLMAAGEGRGVPRARVRTCLEVGVFALGLALGGSFGPATIALALTIGPLLGVTAQALDDHAKGRTLRQVDAHPQARHPSAMAGARR